MRPKCPACSLLDCCCADVARKRQVEQRSNPLAGMGGAGPDPAALLRLLLTYGRLQEAAALAVSYLDYWDKQVRAEAIWIGDGGVHSASCFLVQHLMCCCAGLSC